MIRQRFLSFDSFNDRPSRPAQRKIIAARRSVICVFVIAPDSPKARENNDGIWCRGAAENARNLRRVWNRFFVFRGQIGVRLLPRTERRRMEKNEELRGNERKGGTRTTCVYTYIYISARMGVLEHGERRVHVCTRRTNTSAYAH